MAAWDAYQSYTTEESDVESRWVIIRVYIRGTHHKSTSTSTNVGVKNIGGPAIFTRMLVDQETVRKRQHIKL